MDCRSIRGTFFTALAMGSAACAVILGDAPEGKLGSELDGSPAPDGAGTDGAAPVPEGWIYRVPNARLLDMVVDTTDIFWLRASPAADGGGETFAVEACSKNGGDFRQIATVPVQPESLVLSDNDVFWSVNRDAANSGGVWRGNKRGGPPPTAQLTKREYAGPITIRNSVLFTATHSGNLFYDAPDTGEVGGAANAGGDAASMTASTDRLYWSTQEPRVWSIPAQRGHWIADTFADDFPAAPRFLSFDNGILYWAIITPPRATISSKCASGCGRKEIVTQPTGFEALTVRNNTLYWTANENGTGVVRRCADLTNCQLATSHWWSNPNTEVSRITSDENDSNVYFAAKQGADTYIVKRPR